MTYDWRSDAECRGQDPDIWFPVRGAPSQPAKDICASCSVIAECLDYAVRSELHGTWGGKSERQRRILRTAQGIGLSRPEAVVGLENRGWRSAS